jgi:fluoride exporter
VIRNLLLVALGGAAGSVLRYLLSLGLSPFGASGIPWGTLTANLVGCFVLGVLLSKIPQLTEAQRLVLATGFCGGLTTLSTLEAETLQLSSLGLVRAALYLVASVGLGLLAVAGGGWVAQRIG